MAAPSAAVEARGDDDLTLRVRSGLILGPLALVFVWLGGGAFFAWLLVAGVIALHEWVRLSLPDLTTRQTLPFQLCLLAMLVTAATAGPLPAIAAGLILGPVCWVLGIGLAQTLEGWPPASHADALWLAGGVPYLGLSVTSLLWLRDLPDSGLALTLFLLAAVWATDIGAFFLGRLCGGPRLAREISPQKTWSGLLGGMVCAGLAGGLVALSAGGAHPWIAVLVGFGIALIGQMGDLFESVLKRRHHKKDSGGLIPGHGGVLDRVDGLIASAPALALFHTTLGNYLAWW